jgi:transposase-like protein
VKTSDKLFDLKNDFALWRSKRKRGTPVPNDLKERACKLLDEYDVYRVAKACTVSKNLLDTWKKNLNTSPEEKKPQHFVELG